MVELVSSNISKYDKVNVSLACEFVLASPRLDAQLSVQETKILGQATEVRIKDVINTKIKGSFSTFMKLQIWET